jgi:reductive dehalogenase
MTEGNTTKLARRQFLKGVGAIMAATAATSAAGPLEEATASAPGGGAADGPKQRYPWWVKEVDEITTEVDWDRWEQHDIYTTTLYAMPEYLKGGADERESIKRQGVETIRRQILDDVPGSTLRDHALSNAAKSVFWWNIFGDEWMIETREKTNQYFDIQKFDGVSRWEGSPEEGSATLKQAARFFGAPQIGIAELEPRTLWKEVEYDPEMRYVVSILATESWEGQKRHDTALGYASNRYARAQGGITSWAVMNFVNLLGYRFERLYGPYVYYAVKSGLGELGRHNRTVSPIFGSSFLLHSYVTDMPLAIDKPIDFGLQQFCRKCRKCAEACPAGAINTELDPSWTTRGPWNKAGKKGWFEHSVQCRSYIYRTQSVCSRCLSACPWAKQDETALHEISRIFGARAPDLSGVLKTLDDAFGYGHIEDADEMDAWWELDLPTYGRDTVYEKRGG